MTDFVPDEEFAEAETTVYITEPGCVLYEAELRPKKQFYINQMGQLCQVSLFKRERNCMSLLQYRDLWL